jgi:hypothetical protein
MSSELVRFFDERFGEIEAYLSLLDEIQSAARSGPPRIEGSSSRITASQQKILHSSVYLQLYNLVEATISRCLAEVTRAASAGARWRPMDLNVGLRSEWVRVAARTHVDLTPENRLKNAVEMFDHLMKQLPLADFKVEVGGGGNWDDDAIEKVSSRLGCDLAISKPTRTAVKRHVRDDLGALKLVKNRRNSLAHGSVSFVECGDQVTVSELRGLVQCVGYYLSEAIASFDAYIRALEFLHPDARSAGATG